MTRKLKDNRGRRDDRHARLGQHFLTRPEMAGWVADAVTLNKGDIVLEIGPGHGILTRELLKRAGRVVAIEKDAVLFSELLNTFGPEIASGQLTLLNKDIRNFDPSSYHSLLTTNYFLVANIPYYLTGYIIRKFLTAQHQPCTMAVLIQKEVAERIVAQKGKESLLSLSVKAYGSPTLVRIVKAGAFNPPPKVDSAILTISHIARKNFLNTTHEETFFYLLHCAFTKKRKMLGTSLKTIIDSGHLATFGTFFSERPEHTSLHEWLQLSALESVTLAKNNSTMP